MCYELLNQGAAMFTERFAISECIETLDNMHVFENWLKKTSSHAGD